MKPAKYYVVEVVRIVLPLAILAGGVFAYAAISSQREPPPQVERQEKLPAVETVAVLPHEGGLEIDVDGTVVPHREVTLSAEVSGRITSKADACRAGRYVEEGTLLLEIDERTYQLDVQRLEKEVEQAEATLEELEVEIQNSESLAGLADEEVALRQNELQRQENLAQRGAGSASLLDEAKRLELAARNNQTTLKNQVRILNSRNSRLSSALELAKTRLEQAELDLEKSKVRAPISGVVVSESVEVDTFVQPGTSLVVIEDVSTVEVRSSLRMEELAWVLQHQEKGTDSAPQVAGQPDYHLPPVPVSVRYWIGPQEYEWQGTLSRYEGIGLNEKTRTVPVRIIVPRPTEVRPVSPTSSSGFRGPQALVRGMYVDAKLKVQPEVQLLRVPELALQPGNMVWAVENGELKRVALSRLVTSGEHLVVPAAPDGLFAGDQLVVTPMSTARSGMDVKVVETEAADQTRRASSSAND